MTTYDDRQKGFEGKFALDEELMFKATARRNKLVGLWAAEKLGKQGDAAEQYAKDVVMADFEESGDDDVVGKLLKDFTDAGIAVTKQEILEQLDGKMHIAREQVLADKKG
ncbi:MAG: DUF1476 domain-containing protein [Alphaproteobacteria bacterium]